MSIIFSNEVVVRRDALYDAMIAHMVASGWTDVSSKAATDYNVMTSPGVGGGKALVIQMRPTNTDDANSVKSSAYSMASYRLPSSYVPGAVDTAGTFGNDAAVWQQLNLAPIAATATTVTPATEITYRWYCDANKLLMLLQYPTATGLLPMFIYMGLPESYATEGPSSGVLFGATSCQHAGVFVTAVSTDLGTAMDNAVRTAYTNVAYRNPNIENKYVMNEIFYGLATEGVRGKLVGLYAVPNQNMNTGDSLTIGAELYYLFIPHSYQSSSFSAAAFCIRVM